MTELAAAIAPAPQVTSPEVISAMFLAEFISATMVLLSFLIVRTAAGVLSLLGGVLVFTLVSWRIVKAFRIRSLVRAGLPKATPFWRTGRYCSRCGVVTSETGVDEPLEFRQAVWDRGGYGRVRA